jgi:polyhydroxyalkanoate synthesis regulator phasin
MDKLSDNLKKIFLAGIGAVAVTAEKSKDLLEEMVEKGELTVEQGKVLNEELKHNVKTTVKEKVNALKPATAEELSDILDKMTPEQIAALKEQIQKKEEAAETAEDEA